MTSSNSKLIFIFIGHDFYRKGGLVVLRVFENLSKQFDNFQVITVGSLRNDVPAIFDKSMEKETRELIGKYNGKWLTHYNTLPNNEVLELIKRADVGLLPTYSDVFGYSCLEFQACGCPVISSDVRAMPEINNNDCGWMMEIGIKTKHRELANIKQVIRTCEMEHKLQHIVESILLQGEIPRAKIQKSIERIVKYHSPEQHKYILQYTYLKATKNE